MTSSVVAGATARRPSVQRQPLARGPVLAAMAAVAILLTAVSNAYGWHRDELYFRMLKPGWGYVDQSPLTPLVVRFFSEHVADEPWAIRIPATTLTVASVLVSALITRELGGSRSAQALCAWGYAFCTTALVFGHVMLTSSWDLVVWPLVTLFVLRAQLRAEPRWWVAAGVVVGLSMYNKLLIAMLLAAFAGGLLLMGPRRVLWSRWVWSSAVLAVAIGAPNLVYQATHSWPELTMGRALADHNAGDVHVLLLPFLVILIGPPLVPVWVAGLVALFRRSEWRPVRFVGMAFPVLVVLVFVAGTQFYYPSGLLVVLFAIGCVPTGELISRSRAWRELLVTGIVVNSVICAFLALPLVPLSAVGGTPIPGINQTAQDSVGWPAYVRQIATVYDDLPPSQARTAVVITSNYGEAGALARFGPALGVSTVYSAHNQLYYQSRPPGGTKTAVVVGGELPTFRQEFQSCRVAGHLHDNVGVDNEEQGEPIAVCRGPVAPWPAVWAALQHYD